MKEVSWRSWYALESKEDSRHTGPWEIGPGEKSNVVSPVSAFSLSALLHSSLPDAVLLSIFSHSKWYDHIFSASEHRGDASSPTSVQNILENPG